MQHGRLGAADVVGNVLVAPRLTDLLLQPLELVGGWGHLNFIYAKWNANQVIHESSYDIELAKAEDIADPRAV